MGIPNRDEMEGKFDRAKGTVKDKMGKAMGDRKLEDEGKAERAGGRMQEGYGKARRKVGEALNDMGDEIGR